MAGEQFAPGGAGGLVQYRQVVMGMIADSDALGHFGPVTWQYSLPPVQAEQPQYGDVVIPWLTQLLSELHSQSSPPMLD